jgi:hypothetical protein
MIGTEPAWTNLINALSLIRTCRPTCTNSIRRSAIKRRTTLLTLVKDWNTDPRRAAQQPLQTIGKVKHPISTARESPAEQRRTPAGRRADTRANSLDPGQIDANSNTMINSAVRRRG